MMILCPKCKYSLNKHAKFCPECGFPVGKEELMELIDKALDGQVACPRCSGVLWFHEDEAGPSVCSKCGWRKGMPTTFSWQREDKAVEAGPAAVLEKASRKSLAKHMEEISKENPPYRWPGTDGPETAEERRWATATRDERLEMRLGMLEGAAKVFKEQIAAQTQNLADAQIAINRLKDDSVPLHERVTRLEGTMEDVMNNTVRAQAFKFLQKDVNAMAGRVKAVEVTAVHHNGRLRTLETDMQVNENRFVHTTKAIAAVEDTIKEIDRRVRSVQEKADTTPTTLRGACDCTNQPPAVTLDQPRTKDEFTREQMVDAIEDALQFIGNLDSRFCRALRAAREYIKADAAKDCSKEPARRPLPPHNPPDAHAQPTIQSTG